MYFTIYCTQSIWTHKTKNADQSVEVEKTKRRLACSWRRKSFIKEPPSQFWRWRRDIAMNHEDFTNFMHGGFSFTVQALQLPHTKHKSLTSATTTRKKKPHFLSHMMHSQKHVCLQSSLFKATWMSLHFCLSLCIQELMLQCPRDCVSLSVSRQQVKLSLPWMLSIHLTGYCIINVLALHDEKNGKISYIWNE